MQDEKKTDSGVELGQWQKPDVYALKHISDEERMKSQSGGAFAVISDVFVENKGVVYGCVLSDDLLARHMRAETIEERDRMRGSKYIQSDLGDVFLNVKKDLEEGRNVLFTGTSCQVAGLKNFLGKDYKTLLCVDIICHGVPSPMVWKDYCTWVETKYQGKILEAVFRNKKFGWRSHRETFQFKKKNGSIVTVDSDIFARLFYAHNILRESCYKCPYKDTIHPGDITVADYWGIENAAPELEDKKGVSLVLINNERGALFWEQIKDKAIYKRTSLQDSMQIPMCHPFERPKMRIQFWEDYYSMPFSKITVKYAGQDILRKIKRFLLR